MDRGAWQTTVHGIPKSQTRLTEQLTHYQVEVAVFQLLRLEGKPGGMRAPYALS